MDWEAGSRTLVSDAETAFAFRLLTHQIQKPRRARDDEDDGRGRVRWLTGKELRAWIWLLAEFVSRRDFSGRPASVACSRVTADTRTHIPLDSCP